MNHPLKIGLSALSGIGLGLLWSYAYKSDTEDSRSEYSHNHEKAKKITENGQDHFNPAAHRIKKDQTKKPIKSNHHEDLKREIRQSVVAGTYDPLKKIEKAGNSLVAIPLPQRKTHLPSRNGRMLSPVDVTQVTVTNTSSEERDLILWGENEGSSASPPEATDVEAYHVTQTIPLTEAVHPVAVAVNPANGYLYTANQLSNNISIISGEGSEVATVQLQPEGFPGHNSPVALTINTRIDSPHYGRVYVAGSIANTVSIIDLTHQLVNQIPVGVRPVAIAFNPVNEQIYVVNLVSNNITVIDATTESVSSTLLAGAAPMDVAIHPINGNTYIANSGEDSISVFGSDDTSITTILGVSSRPISITYHPVNDRMYVVAADSNTIIPIDPAYDLQESVAVGSDPYRAVFNPSNDYLYVSNRADQTYSIIAPDHTLRATLALGSIANGFTIHPSDNTLFSTNTSANALQFIGYPQQSSSITINEDYQQKKADFQHRPAIVKHLKIVCSGEQRLTSALRLQEKSMTGKVKTASLSLSKYSSPRHFLNVYEVSDITGTIIDGRNSWRLKVPGEQTLTLMIAYQQLNIYSNLLKNKSLWDN